MLVQIESEIFLSGTAGLFDMGREHKLDREQLVGLVGDYISVPENLELNAWAYYHTGSHVAVFSCPDKLRIVQHYVVLLCYTQYVSTVYYGKHLPSLLELVDRELEHGYYSTTVLGVMRPDPAPNPDEIMAVVFPWDL